MTSKVGSRRGFTLIELVVAMGAAVIVVAFVVQALVGLEHDQNLRKKVVDVQGTARLVIDNFEADLRHGSLAIGTGVIWTNSGGRTRRPAVQVFTNVSGGGNAILADAKPQTDALLIVEAVPGAAARTALVGNVTTSVGGLNVTSANVFNVGDPILLGDYGDASWGVIGAVTASGTTNQLTLSDQSANVLPGAQVPQLRAGAMVRRARARLYYVNTADQLVRLALRVPRAPGVAADVTERLVLGDGFENMQVDCLLDNGTGGFTACSDATNPAPVLASADPITVEAATAFGTFGPAAGPRLTAANVGRLRAVVVNLAIRSRTAIPASSQGDPKIPLVGAAGVAVTPAVGSTSGASDTAAYVRRSYRLVTGIRNTSLGNL